MEVFNTCLIIHILNRQLTATYNSTEKVIAPRKGQGPRKHPNNLNLLTMLTRDCDQYAKII